MKKAHKVREHCRREEKMVKQRERGLSDLGKDKGGQDVCQVRIPRERIGRQIWCQLASGRQESLVPPAGNDSDAQRREMNQELQFQ